MSLEDTSRFKVTISNPYLLYIFSISSKKSFIYAFNIDNIGLNPSWQVLFMTCRKSAVMIEFGSTRFYYNFITTSTYEYTLSHTGILLAATQRQARKYIHVYYTYSKTDCQVKKIQINICFLRLLSAGSFTYDPFQEIFRYSYRKSAVLYKNVTE